MELCSITPWFFMAAAWATRTDIVMTAFRWSLPEEPQGASRGGRHIVAKPQTQMANLLLGILDKAKVPADSIGDSTEVFQL